MLSGEIGIAEAAVRALAAGMDLVCLGNSVWASYAASELDDEAIVAEARDAVIEALDAGRLSLERMRESVQRIERMRRWRRKARSQDSAVEEHLPDVVARLDEVGQRVASEVVHSKGDAHLEPGDTLVDLRRLGEHAAGSTAPPLARILSEEIGIIPAEDLVEAEEECAEPQRLALLTRTTDDYVERIVAEHPDAVVIHAGVPAAAPDADNVVYSFGVAKANAEAVARLVEEDNEGGQD